MGSICYSMFFSNFLDKINLKKEKITNCIAISAWSAGARQRKASLTYFLPRSSSGNRWTGLGGPIQSNWILIKLPACSRERFNFLQKSPGLVRDFGFKLCYIRIIIFLVRGFKLKLSSWLVNVCLLWILLKRWSFVLYFL